MSHSHLSTQSTTQTPPPITPSTLLPLFSASQIPQHLQHSLASSLSNLFNLHMERNVKEMREELAYWKGRRANAPKQQQKASLKRSQSTNAALKVQNDTSLTTQTPTHLLETLRLKMQLIEDIIAQLSSFEQDQALSKHHMEAFMTRNASALADMHEEYKAYAREMRDAITKWGNEVALKMRDYADAEQEMRKVMREMRDWTAQGRIEIERRDARIEQLTNENRMLRTQIETLMVQTKQWNSQRDREVKKWKDISLLTIPLVEMVNKSLKGSTATNGGSSPVTNPLSPSVIESLRKDLTRSISAPDVLTSSAEHPTTTYSDSASPMSNHASPVRVSTTLTDSDPQNIHNSPTILSSASPHVPSVIVRRSSQGFEQQESRTSSPSATIRLSLNSPHSDHQSPAPPTVSLQLSTSHNWARDILENTPSNLVLDAPPSTTHFICKRLIQHQIGHKSRHADHIDGYARRAKFFHPVALAVHQNMCIVAEAGNHCLRKVNLQDNLVSTLTSGKKGTEGIDCPGGLCFDPLDSTKIYLTDLNQGKIFTVDTQNGAVSVVKMRTPLSTTQPTAKPPPLTTDLPFTNAYDCAMSPHDNTTLYVSHDTGIAMINLKSRDVTFIGSSKKKRGCRDGSFQKARFDRPNGLAFLDAHRFVVCDTGNHLLRCVDLEANTVSTLSGYAGYSCLRDEALAQACFTSPRKICALMGRTRQFLFVTEENSHLRVVDLGEKRVYTMEMKPELDSPFGVGAKFSKHERTVHVYVADCNAHIVVHLKIDLFGNEGMREQLRSLSENEHSSVYNEYDEDHY